MKIAVCIKSVPDTETRIRIGDDGRSIDDRGLRFILNPYDEFALEEALRLREQVDKGEVVAFSLGNDVSWEVIRTALAMGADRGVLLKSSVRLPDPLAVARLLSAALEPGGYDLILFGKLAIDDGSGAVGAMVAELLGRPCVSSIVHLELADGGGTAKREIEGGLEVVEFSLPAVLTADKGLNEPRRPSLRGIVAAKGKPVEVQEVQPDVCGMEVLRIDLPPDRAEGRILGEGPAAVPALIAALRTEAKVL